MRQFFTNSYKKIKDKIIGEASKPWIQNWEIDIIKKILVDLQPKKCLEWGAGYSTIYFTKFLPKDANWICVEHNWKWANRIKYRLLFHHPFRHKIHVEICHILPNSFPFTDKNRDGLYADLKDYVQFPNRFGHFDFILIDGRARKDCLIRAFELISDKGVVILHDANRKYYHEPFSLYKHQVFFGDHREDEGGLWLGSKGLNIKSVLGENKIQA